MKICYAVNPDGTEVTTNGVLFRHNDAVDELVQKFGAVYKGRHKEKDFWCNTYSDGYYTVPRFEGVVLPKGSIKKLIGKDLTWNDGPTEVEL